MSVAARAGVKDGGSRLTRLCLCTQERRCWCARERAETRRDSRRRDATRRLGLGLGLATHGYLDTVPGRLARTAVLSACAHRATDKLIARRPLRVLLVPGTAQCSLSPPPIRLVPHVTMLQLQNKPLETTTTTTSPGNPSPSRPELSPQPPLAHQSPPATFEHGSID